MAALVRVALLAVGIALVVFGVMWALQGLGILMWPPQSAMLAQREWGLYGLVAAAIGGLVIWLALRIGTSR
ncbi:MAG: hypothetical protein AAF494_04760 [Pseudomonadota bacterium]